MVHDDPYESLGHVPGLRLSRVEQIPLHAKAAVHAVAWDPSGSPRVCGFTGNARAAVWDVDTGRMQREMGETRPYRRLQAGAWVERGLFLVAFESRPLFPAEPTSPREFGPPELQLYDVERDELLRTWPLDGRACVVGLSADGRRAAITIAGDAHVLDLDTGRLDGGGGDGPWIRAVGEARSPDGRWMARAGFYHRGSHSLVMLEDLGTGAAPFAAAQRGKEKEAVQRYLEERRLAGSSRTSPDGRFLVSLVRDWEWSRIQYVSDDLAHLKLHDAATGAVVLEATERKIVPEGLGPFAPDGSRVLARTSHELVWIDAKTLAVDRNVIEGRSQRDHALSVVAPFLLADGLHFLDRERRQMVVVDRRTGGREPIGFEADYAQACAVTPDDGKALIWAGRTRELALVDLHGRRCLATLRLPEDLEYAFFVDSQAFVVRTTAGALLTFELAPT